MSDGSQLPGATPGDDLSGLRQTHLIDRRSRDAVETELIDRAYQKYIYRARRKKPGVPWLTPELIRQAHRDMFGDLWEWAGTFRTTNLNIGVDWHQIQEQLGVLCGDFHYWNAETSTMPPLEIAARLQNRLTRIHPFKNGNGRHARLITDIFFHSRKLKLPQWPQIQQLPQGDSLRLDYIAAMKRADQEDFNDLMAFIKKCLTTNLLE